MQTPYLVMVSKADKAEKWDNYSAAIYSWFTLAGFIAFPGTFTSLKNSDSLSNSKDGQVVQDAIQNVSLLAVGSICYFIGTVGSYWLWWKWRKNYVWLRARIFLYVLQSISNG